MVQRTSARWTLLAAFCAASLLACGNNDNDDSLTPDVGDVADTTDEETVEPRCGDGSLDEGELCDGAALGEATCEGLGYVGGELGCTASCTYDTEACEVADDEVCGDGLLAEGELCDGDALGGVTCEDLGYLYGDLACDDSCGYDESGCVALTSCGDGVLAAGEECDDGNNNDNDGCTHDCRSEICGDGVLQEGEECDTGGAILLTCEDVEGNPPGIVQCVDCALGLLECPDAPVCGNGLTEYGEACDDGNDDPDDGCDACLSTTCGDGTVDPYEICDGDGELPLSCDDLGFAAGEIVCTEICTVSLDGCRNPLCGDGFVDGDETCDDGNTDNGDGCSSRCQEEYCGDGVVQDGLGELCDGDAGEIGCTDLGFARGPLGCDDACLYDTSACVAADECGDGVVDADEACDDGEDNGPEGACTDACTLNLCYDVACPADDQCVAYTCDPSVGCVEQPLEGDDEVCDGVDNDCDGAIDEDVLNVYFLDEDGDGYGGATTIEACEAPEGYVDLGEDCDDTNDAMYPGGDEVCDGVDNDCNGETDEFALTTYYLDEDGDGYGSEATVEACEAPEGYVELSEDCDDANDTMFPGNTEVCDGVDNDCNGEVDEFQTTTFFVDLDGDGYGGSETAELCAWVEGYAEEGDDCDDEDSAVFPGADEVCNGADDNCDGSVDEGVTTTYYSDEDGDGYGIDAVTTEACEVPENYAEEAGDCSGGDPLIHPDADEVCGDDVDNNCDGAADCDDETCAEAPLCMGAYPIAAPGDGIVLSPPAHSSGAWLRLESDCSTETEAGEFNYEVHEIVNLTGDEQTIVVTANWAEVDGYLYAYGSPFDPMMASACIVANDDYGEDTVQSRVTLSIAPGQQLSIVASTYSALEPIGAYDIDVWTVAMGDCGDGYCDGSEDPETCPADCSSFGECGDGSCSYDEYIYESCPMDCDEPIGCGDGFCDESESPLTCPDDCGGGGCGDGECSPMEGEMGSCPEDCDECGDGICTTMEMELMLCPEDCP